MNTVVIEKKDRRLKASVRLPFSKSISNRLLTMEALSGKTFPLKNISTADDTILLRQLLSSKEKTFDAQNAGTCFRFLTAYLSLKEGKRTLTGSYRMKQRPTGELVDALRQLGADIKYLEKEKFPPLLIHGKKLTGGTININASNSSQFVSSMLLVAPYVEGGVKIKLSGKVASRPYIEMTLKLMERFGINFFRNENVIEIHEQEYIPLEYSVEPDWSSAAFWYAMAALSDEAEIFLEGLSQESIQGDSIVAELMKDFGVETKFTMEGALITHGKKLSPKNFLFNFTNHPDLAPAFFVLCFALGVNAKFTGLKNLSIKESNRMEALKRELEKCGAGISKVSEDEYHLRPHPLTPSPLGEGEHSRALKVEGYQFETYNDHRLAMSLAMLAIPLGKVEIKNPAVVSKSYPEFWNDLRSAGFGVKFL